MSEKLIGDVPIRVRSHVPSAHVRDRLVVESEEQLVPKVITELRELNDLDSYFLERIALNSRVIIIEGTSGSGKDTLQTYLKTKLQGRDVYDYSEGDVLHSWKQLQIEGISEVRIKFMKRFVNYIRHVVTGDDNAVFLLNRFHLSTYASTIIHQPKLAREYAEIISVLRMLPVHVFILQLDEKEIEKRSAHPERSGAWQKYLQQMMDKGGFRNTFERFLWQQRYILEAAKKQQIPYSVLKFLHVPSIRDQQTRISKDPSMVRRSVRLSAAETKPARKKRDVPETV